MCQVLKCVTPAPALAGGDYTFRAGSTFSESIIMKSVLFALTIFITLSATAHADCNARKVARHAAMQATVGVSAHCMNDHPVKNSVSVKRAPY